MKGYESHSNDVFKCVNVYTILHKLYLYLRAGQSFHGQQVYNYSNNTFLVECDIISTKLL